LLGKKGYVVVVVVDSRVILKYYAKTGNRKRHINKESRNVNSSKLTVETFSV